MNPQPLNDLEILNLVRAERASAEAWSDELSSERAQALDYYYGRPQGDEVEGRSQVVSTDVADTVEWMMPSLMRTVAGDDELVAFEGRDDDQAKIATALVQHVIWEMNDGWTLSHDSVKDGLLSKTGAVKWRWCERTEPIDRDYQNLSEMEVALLLQGIQGGEATIIGQEAIDQPDGSQRYNIRVRVTRKWGQVDLQAIPPEELRVPRNARNIDDKCRYIGHDVPDVTRSDLVAMGVPIDVVMELPRYDIGDRQIERYARNTSAMGDAPAENVMMEPVEYVEHYVLADVDGDGIAERRLICTSGEKIVRNEILPGLPIAAWSPFRMPHTATGRSLADRITDIQRIRTALLRGVMDNIYTVNAGGRYVAQTGQVNMDDLLTVRAGGVVRAKDINALRQLPVEYSGDKIMQVFELTHAIREERTGVNRHSQGVNAESLHQTAKMGMEMLAQGDELKELIVRSYVESLWKPMCRGILDLLVRYQDEPMQLRVAGKMLEADLSSMNSRMGLRVKVGSGNMKKSAKVANLKELIASQVEALSQGLPIVGVEQIYKSTADLTELSGFTANRYWIDPSSPEGQALQQPKGDQQPQIDPLVQAEMVKAQSRESEAAARIELQAAKEAENARLQREKLAREDARFYTDLELKYAANVPGSKV